MKPPALARRLDGLESSAIRDILTVTARAEIISLAGGLPDPELVPRDRMRAVAEQVLSNLSSVQYTETPGWAGLREVLAERDAKRLGRATGVEQIFVTHGSQQALSLLATALLDPGATVVVEDPSYVGALQVFRAADTVIETVPLDSEGMVVEALEQLLADGLRPTLVHTVSNFHNPRGVTMRADRRARLASLAEEFGFWIIEDDPYGELWFHEPTPEPVAVHSDHVIRLSSTSKILAPSLRTGWLRAPAEVCKAVELVRQGADLCGSALNHQIAAELLADAAWLDSHLDKVRASYAERAEILCSAIDKAFGDAIERTDAAGGMFTWIEFRDGTDTKELLPLALDEGVAFVPGDAFGDGYRNALRLCFTTGSGPVLEEAVARLARAHARR